MVDGMGFVAVGVAKAGKRRSRCACAAFRALPPSRRSPEEEFRDEARSLQWKEEELSRAAAQYVVVSHREKRLIAEVIDHVEARQMHWLRPCLMQEVNNQPTVELREWQGFESESSESAVYDLRGTSDLLLPDMFAQPPDTVTRLAAELLMTSHSPNVPFDDPDGEEQKRAQDLVFNMMKEINDDHPDAFRAK